MSEWVLNEAEELLVANALRYYINAGVMVTEDQALATDLLNELES